MITAPHLKPAYILDRIIWNFSLEIGEGKWAGEGIPAELRTEDHLVVGILLCFVLISATSWVSRSRFKTVFLFGFFGPPCI